MQSIAESSLETAMDDREAYLERLQAQVDRWQAQIHSLKAQANVAQGETEQGYERRIEELEEKQAEAVAKIEEMRETSDEAWGGLVGDFRGAWEELEGTMAVLIGRFHNQ
jgi:peptidoglycan hydrolase CwlO-like protein